jgi:hypothetical protein
MTRDNISLFKLSEKVKKYKGGNIVVLVFSKSRECFSLFLVDLKSSKFLMTGCHNK